MLRVTSSVARRDRANYATFSRNNKENIRRTCSSRFLTELVITAINIDTINGTSLRHFSSSLCTSSRSSIQMSRYELGNTRFSFFLFFFRTSLLLYCNNDQSFDIFIQFIATLLLEPLNK